MGLFGGFLGFLAGSFLANNCLEPIGKGSNPWMFTFHLFGLAMLVAVVVTVAASWIPAMRAARLDPAITLREE